MNNCDWVACNLDMDDDRIKLVLKLGLVTIVVRDLGVIFIEYYYSLVHIYMNKLEESRSHVKKHSMFDE